MRRFDADPHRVAIGGFSMGGFGALNLARISPAMFHPSLEATTYLAKLLNGELFRSWPGRHGMSYIRARTRDYLAFYAQALENCR